MRKVSLFILSTLMMSSLLSGTVFGMSKPFPESKPSHPSQVILKHGSHWKICAPGHGQNCERPKANIIFETTNGGTFYPDGGSPIKFAGKWAGWNLETSFGTLFFHYNPTPQVLSFNWLENPINSDASSGTGTRYIQE